MGKKTGGAVGGAVGDMTTVFQEPL